MDVPAINYRPFVGFNLYQLYVVRRTGVSYHLRFVGRRNERRNVAHVLNVHIVREVRYVHFVHVFRLRVVFVQFRRTTQYCSPYGAFLRLRINVTLFLQRIRRRFRLGDHDHFLPLTSASSRSQVTVGVFDYQGRFVDYFRVTRGGIRRFLLNVMLEACRPWFTLRDFFVEGVSRLRQRVGCLVNLSRVYRSIMYVCIVIQGKFSRLLNVSRNDVPAGAKAPRSVVLMVFRAFAPYRLLNGRFIMCGKFANAKENGIRRWSNYRR